MEAAIASQQCAMLAAPPEFGDLAARFAACGLGAEEVRPVNGKFPEGWTPAKIKQTATQNLVNLDLAPVLRSCEFYVDPDGAGAAADPRCLATEAPGKVIVARQTPDGCLVFLIGERDRPGGPVVSVSPGVACP